AGDDEVLPGEQSQSSGLLPPAGVPAAVLLRAVLHAAQGPQAGHVPRDRRLRGVGPQQRLERDLLAVRRLLLRGGPPHHGRGPELPLHPRSDREGDRRGTGRADRPLHREPACLRPAELLRDGGQKPAHADARPAADLRHIHHPLPGGTDGLLDHDQLLDDRAAVDRPQDGRRAWAPAGPSGSRRAVGGTRRRRRDSRRQGASEGRRRREGPGRQDAEGGRGGGHERSLRLGTAPIAQKEEANGAATVSASDAAARVRHMLEEIVRAVGVDAEVTVSEDADGVHANLEGDDLGLLIGRHGQTIDAIQHLAYRVAYRGEEERKRVTVDAAGYRERRAALLQQDADEAVEQVLRTGDAVALDAMNAVERRVVHEYLRDRDGIETYSEGTEPDRYLVVAPAGD